MEFSLMRSVSPILTRRSALQGLAGLGLTSALAGPAAALTEAQASALVNSAVGEINAVIASGKPISGMIRDFERIFGRYADVNIIARSTLGADANRLSASQMRAFTSTFQGYIARKYGKRFEEFRGGRIEVRGVRAVKSWQEVQATMYLRGQSPVSVIFLVSDRSGRDKFFDLILEGVSLRISERSEIGSLLDSKGGNVDAMIAELRTRG
jgi:phospholipid transport system substrate-binding protein